MRECSLLSKMSKWTRTSTVPLFPQIRLTLFSRAKHTTQRHGTQVCLHNHYWFEFHRWTHIFNLLIINRSVIHVCPKTRPVLLSIPVLIDYSHVLWKTQNVTKVYIKNRLSKYLIMSCLSSLNDDNIVTPIRKWPQMWCWSISIDRQIIVVVLSFRHCPGPMHEGLNWEWMWLDFQSPSLNSHAGNTNSSI